MAETGYLVSALVTGALLLAVWALVTRMGNWRRYDSDADASGGVVSALNCLEGWTVGFCLLAFAVGATTLLLVSDAAFASAVGNWTALAGAFGVLLVGFVLWGTYSSARHRGHHSARAALLSAWVFGSLFVVGIAAKLLLTG